MDCPDTSLRMRAVPASRRHRAIVSFLTEAPASGHDGILRAAASPFQAKRPTGSPHDRPSIGSSGERLSEVDALSQFVSGRHMHYLLVRADESPCRPKQARGHHLILAEIDLVMH
jgi:hypothetical protein